MHVKQLPELKARVSQSKPWPDADAVSLQSTRLLPCLLLPALEGPRVAGDMQNISQAKEWV